MYQKLKLISATLPRESNWKALVYFNLYRFLVAFLFVSLYWIGQLPDPLGVENSTLFSVTTHFYLFISVVLYLFTQIKKPPYLYQVISHVLTDIIVIILLMNASAGLNSGFGMLLVITVAGGSILTPGKIGILYAAIAAIAVLGHEVYVQLNQVLFLPNYTHAGFLGITFF